MGFCPSSAQTFHPEPDELCGCCFVLRCTVLHCTLPLHCRTFINAICPSRPYIHTNYNTLCPLLPYIHTMPYALYCHTFIQCHMPFTAIPSYSAICPSLPYLHTMPYALHCHTFIQCHMPSSKRCSLNLYSFEHKEGFALLKIALLKAQQIFCVRAFMYTFQSGKMSGQGS